jgi:hypothetical protein
MGGARYRSGLRPQSLSLNPCDWRSCFIPSAPGRSRPAASDFRSFAGSAARISIRTRSDDAHRHSWPTRSSLVFLAESQVPGYITYLVVRTVVEDPMQVASAIRHELQGVAPMQPFADVQPMGQYVTAALARPRLYTAFLSSFASLALVLAAIGLYGLMAYVVRVRTHEIGIRMALGADRSTVLRSILEQAAGRVGAGMLVGLVFAVPVTRLIGSLLYGVRASDPLMFVAVAVVLAITALVAVYVPVRRASKIDPMQTLRYE